MKRYIHPTLADELQRIERGWSDGLWVAPRPVPPRRPSLFSALRQLLSGRESANYFLDLVKEHDGLD
jgi:hypothetical protein